MNDSGRECGNARLEGWAEGPGWFRLSDRRPTPFANRGAPSNGQADTRVQIVARPTVFIHLWKSRGDLAGQTLV
jgi:hypothetical protein